MGGTTLGFTVTDGAMALTGVPTGMIHGIMEAGTTRGLIPGTMVTDGVGLTMVAIGAVHGLITVAIGGMPATGDGLRIGVEVI